MKRVSYLPHTGIAIINTDLHGNGEDFRTLREIFLTTRKSNPQTHWVLLGDLLHAPNENARKIHSLLYDYPDESWSIVNELISLSSQYKGFVHFVLGNHDYGHIGGPHTSKFYADEVTHLEETLTNEQIKTLHTFLQKALLAVIAPCGAFLCHGSPDDSLRALEDLDQINLPPTTNKLYQETLLKSFLTSYGQPREISEKFLKTVSKSLPDQNLRFVIHGHDRDEEGFFYEGDNQLCSVIFGAPKENKRYILLDLSTQYQSVYDLRDSFEIKKLYPSG